jgi:hypothetical protein
MTERLEDTDFYKRIKAYNERWEKEEELKRQEIIEKENKDLFRKIPEQAKYWIKAYLNLSGIQRNQYSQIVDTYKRLSLSQIRGILREVHGFNVSEEMLGKYRKFLIREGLLRTDEEIEKERPSEDELREIRKEGARSQAIERSKEKTHLDKEELEGILERDKPKETKKNRIEELTEKQERGLCLTNSEEEELEESEEEEENG